MKPLSIDTKVVVDCNGLQALITALKSRGYQTVGPTLREQAIVYDQIDSVTDLPEGWTDRQEAATYKLEKRNDAALFGYAVGPQSWKRFLFPPSERLWSARRQDDSLSIELEAPTERYAFIGVRACELHAIAIQDRVFAGGPYRDDAYRQRREHCFVVAVNCGHAGGTCFCVSMNTGPKVSTGFDLSLTELLGARHEFLVEVGSNAGAEVLTQITSRTATQDDLAAAEAVVARTAAHMGRSMNNNGIKPLLQDNPNHPRWDDVAERCLSCANCTMVCPTCFCSTVTDHTELGGDVATRQRHWDSCFTLDFSYLHGGSVRRQTRSRYRQWITHKLASWIDQFGTSGCVGCGRCITWCPVGIDITEEVAAIRAAPQANETDPHGNT